MRPDTAPTESLHGLVPGPDDDGSTVATLLSGSRPAAGSGPSASSGAGASTGDSVGWSEPVARALRGEEIARARGWSTVLIVLCISGLAGLPLLPGAPVDKALFSVTMVLLAAAGIWCWLRCRDEANYTPGVFRVYGYIVATGSFEVEYFLGAFSPTPLVVTLGITFFGMGMDRKHALAIPIYAIAGYFLLGMLITLGVIEDRGVIDSDGTPLQSKLFFVALAPLVLATSLWMARVSRRAMADAMAGAADATRLAAQREALLAEAEQNLEQLLRAGAGQSGRFTGSTAGDYELRELIGRGAMGEVYVGVHPESDRRAAIKLLRPEALADERMLERFMREGKAAGSLDSPNVVRVLDVGTVQPSGFPFIAMELLRGDDLAAILRHERTLNLVEVCQLMGDVCRGLEAAHSAGIIHRDLKPQNLFCHRDSASAAGVWKILDFGVSKLVDSQGTLTQRGVVGTPGYMSPEQARGANVDHRCDIFAMGAVAYRALTGRPAFSGPDLPQILFAIVYQQPPRPSSLVDELPRDVDRVLAVALAKHPGDRFEHPAELAAALERAAVGKLDGELRRRADQLIASHPWSETAPPR